MRTNSNEPQYDFGPEDPDDWDFFDPTRDLSYTLADAHQDLLRSLETVRAYRAPVPDPPEEPDENEEPEEEQEGTEDT